MKTLIALIFTLGLTIMMLAGCASTGTQQSKLERITPEELSKILPQPVATITLSEIVTDSKAGKTVEEIITKINNSNSRYELTPTQTLDLAKQGVDTKVLDYMHQSNELAKQNAIADELNKREKQRRATENALRRERDMAQQYYDPFWGPHFGAFYGRPYFGPIGPGYRHWPRSRFGLGLGFGYPYGW